MLRLRSALSRDRAVRRDEFENDGVQRSGDAGEHGADAERDGFDVRFAVTGDFRIGLNEVAIGLTLPHFPIALARHRLPPAAFIAIQTGAMFAPEEACRLGYVDRVLPPA